jgi:hypothetical protein
MSVWVVCPSKRPTEEVNRWAEKWRARGYKIALWRDDMNFPFGVANYIRSEPTYPGYAVAVNSLIRDVLQTDDACEWAVAAADDVEPDLNHTGDEIAVQCGRYFCNLDIDKPWHGVPHIPRATFGVMQPTGDRWGTFPDHPDPTQRSAYIDRVCGSPWLGREFCKRMYGGNGPYWPEYRHMGVDEELQAVALKLDVLWQRPDLIHFHQHWGRPRPGEIMAPVERMPEFLKEANGGAHWRAYKKLFAEREAAGFPGHEPRHEPI